MQLAAAVEIDFSLMVAPVSLLAEYMYMHGNRSAPDEPDTDLGSSNIGLGIYYVGRPNLQLGVSGVTSLDAAPRRGFDEQGDAEFSDAPTLTYLDLILRYVW